MRFATYEKPTLQIIPALGLFLNYLLTKSLRYDKIKDIENDVKGLEI